MKKLIFLSLMAICFCVRLYAQTNFKYKNASLPVEVRVQDLLSRMTLEEKIAQMRHIHAYSIMENGKLNEEKLEKMIGGQNYGFIEGITLPGKECLTLMNEVQKYMREKTRLGIPVFTLTNLYMALYTTDLLFFHKPSHWEVHLILYWLTK